MRIYQNQFKQSLFWNSLDSLGSQALLVLQHLLVRSFLGIEFHGIFGILYSIFYLSLIIMNLGLDYTLPAFYSYFMSDKLSAQKFVWRYLFAQIGILLLGSILFLFFSEPVLKSLLSIMPCSNLDLSKISGIITPQFKLVLVFSLISEALKRTIKVILQLGFYTPITACVEFFGMMIYMIIFWLAYFQLNTFTISTGWLIFSFVSLIQLLILIFAFSYQIKQLPTAATCFDGLSMSGDKNYLGAAHAECSDSEIEVCSGRQPSLVSRILKTRFFVFSNQIVSQLFSGNFLVPLCAWYVGLQQASFLKIITSISQWLNLVANKVFGISAAALLANIKLDKSADKRSAFNYIINILFQFLLCLIIFLAINIKKIVFLQIQPTFLIQWSTLYLLLLLGFSDGLFVLYERWLVIEERAYYLLISNAFSFLLFSILLKFIGIYSPSVIFILAILSRLLVFLVLAFISFYRWNIFIKPQVNPQILLITFGASILFYFFI